MVDLNSRWAYADLHILPPLPLTQGQVVYPVSPAADFTPYRWLSDKLTAGPGLDPGASDTTRRLKTLESCRWAIGELRTGSQISVEFLAAFWCDVSFVRGDVRHRAHSMRKKYIITVIGKGLSHENVDLRFIWEQTVGIIHISIYAVTRHSMIFAALLSISGCMLKRIHINEAIVTQISHKVVIL